MSTKELPVQIITYLNATIMAKANTVESGMICIFIYVRWTHIYKYTNHAAIMLIWSPAIVLNIELGVYIKLTEIVDLSAQYSNNLGLTWAHSCVGYPCESRLDR
jgi:hypothetical protein